MQGLARSRAAKPFGATSSGTRALRRACAWGRALPAGVAVALAFVLGACNIDRAASIAASAAGPTIAFESIDGPPPAVFNRLVDSMSAEAAARRVAVVSRQNQASYRVRGYLAAHVERERVHIGWVWDVYDSERRRTLRISGEETGTTRRPADAWAAADEQMLRRIAQSSMDRLTAFLASPNAPAVETPEPQPPAIALGSETPGFPPLAALQ